LASLFGNCGEAVQSLDLMILRTVEQSLRSRGMSFKRTNYACKE